MRQRRGKERTWEGGKDLLRMLLRFLARVWIMEVCLMTSCYGISGWEEKEG